VFELVDDVLIIFIDCCCCCCCDCWFNKGDGVVKLRLGGPIGVIERLLLLFIVAEFIVDGCCVIAAAVMIEELIELGLVDDITDADDVCEYVVLPMILLLLVLLDLGDNVRLVLDADRPLFIFVAVVCGPALMVPDDDKIFLSGPMLPLELLNFEANVPGGPVAINEDAVNVDVVVAVVVDADAELLAFLIEFFNA
jgi:hypothetical protein